MTTALAPVNLRLNGIDTRLNAIELAIMMSTNCSVSLPSHDLVSRGQGPNPAHFPATLTDLLVLSNDQCNSLLTHFGIAFRNNATEAAKRVQLANYLGIRRSCMP